MVRRYRLVDVPQDIDGRIELISGNNHRHVHLKHSSTPYSLSGDLHYDLGNSSQFFLVNWSSDGERLGLSYSGLQSIEVEVFADGSARNNKFASTARV